jgi:hemolysin III
MEISARNQTVAEEIANSLSHGLGSIAALIVAAWLLLPSARQGSATSYLATSVFAATMIALYVVSTLYHALPPGRLKNLFLKLDYSAIYLFIAGTYTPFTLGVLHDAGGWIVCVVIWSLALLGVFLKTSNRLNHPVLSTGLYLIMGWLVLLTGRAMIDRIPAWGIFWLVAGGLAYTVGVIFYATDSRLRFGHLVWHLFVMAGTACHVCAVLWHAS